MINFAVDTSTSKSYQYYQSNRTDNTTREYKNPIFNKIFFSNEIIAPINVKGVKNKNFEIINNQLISILNNKYSNEKILEIPNQTATKIAQTVLQIFIRKNFHPENFIPSIDGGFIIEFFVEKRYQCIEIFNEGEIVFIINKNNNPTEIVEVSTERLRKILNNLLDEPNYIM